MVKKQLSCHFLPQNNTFSHFYTKLLSIEFIHSYKQSKSMYSVDYHHFTKKTRDWHVYWCA